jgi:hypothetical protein
MRVDRFCGIGGATRVKAALTAEERAQAPLIELDQYEQQLLHGGRDRQSRGRKVSTSI